MYTKMRTKENQNAHTLAVLTSSRWCVTFYAQTQNSTISIMLFECSHSKCIRFLLPSPSASRFLIFVFDGFFSLLRFWHSIPRRCFCACWAGNKQEPLDIGVCNEEKIILLAFEHAYQWRSIKYGQVHCSRYIDRWQVKKKIAEREMLEI